MSVNATPMGVYWGMKRVGEIIDHGAAGVEAFVERGDRLLQVGIFVNRKEAMRAVSNAAK